MMVEKWITRGFIQASRYASISAKSIQHLSRVYVLLSIISSNDYNNIACYECKVNEILLFCTYIESAKKLKGPDIFNNKRVVYIQIKFCILSMS